MRLKVRHSTQYLYAQPRRRVLQNQRLTPSDFDGQTVLEWSVTTPGAVTGAAFLDGAGDLTLTASMAGMVSEIVVEVAGEVETRDLAGVLRGHRERVPPEAYFRHRRSTQADMALTDLAAGAVAGLPAGATLERAHALAASVAEAIAYRPGSTQPQTTAAEALAQGQGVCQDHAHALIAAALSQDIPARYVAGYLFTDGAGGTPANPQEGGQGAGTGPQGPTDASARTQGAGVQDGPAPASGPGAGRRPRGAGGDAGDFGRAEGGEASHAWAELFVAGLGWVGFDPANRCCPDARYIRLCSGYDADDGAPIRGLVAAGSGGAELHVAVQVEAVQQ